MIEGEAAARAGVARQKGSTSPAELPNQLAEDWQLLDDLLLHSDRHMNNYMVRLDANNKVIDVALIDNGDCLTANPSVIEKRFRGPRENLPIGSLNKQRLRHLLDNEAEVTKELTPCLEPTAIAAFFARAKALIARGTYGNFSLAEINAHLSPELRSLKPTYFGDKTK